jgi:hypothetical protein
VQLMFNVFLERAICLLLAEGSLKQFPIKST